MEAREPNTARTIPELLRELRDETTTLLRQEVKLAKTEMTEKATTVGRNIAYLAVGGMVCFSALIILLMAASAGLTVLLSTIGAEEHSAWLAPLIVGVLTAIIGYALIQKALATLKNESLVPQDSVQSLKEDKEWLKTKAV